MSAPAESVFFGSCYLLCSVVATYIFRDWIRVEKSAWSTRTQARFRLVAVPFFWLVLPGVLCGCVGWLGWRLFLSIRQDWRAAELPLPKLPDRILEPVRSPTALPKE